MTSELDAPIASDEGEKDPDAAPDSPAEATKQDDDPARSTFSDNEFTVKQEFGQSEVVNGIALYNGILNIGQVQSQRTLYADTYDLPREYAALPEFILETPKTYFSNFEKSHLLAIGCEDPEVALSAAQILIQDLRITDSEHRRWYKVREKLDEDNQVAVQSFFPERRNRTKKVVAVVVDAFGDSGRAFVGSLMNDLTAPHWLKDNNVYLLFIVNPACLAEPLGDDRRSSKIPRWKLSCLHNLLRSKFPEKFRHYEQKIREQQAGGRWYKDEIKLYYEVKSYVEMDRLSEELDLREKPRKGPRCPQSIFKDNEPIEKTVIYVASYFPEIALSEFCELVEALLRGREALATIPRFTSDDNHEAAWSHAPRLRSLGDIWNESKDRFIWNNLFRETVSIKDPVKSIDFADYSIRASLRNYLAKERNFFLKDQFNVLQREGFFFHPSGRIGESIVSLTAEMVVAYPDEYDNDWLVEIIKSLRDYARPGESVGLQQEASVTFLPANKPLWGYSRVADLIRQLMKTSQSRGLVNRCLSDLMRDKYYDAVLNLIRRLRFTPDFERLQWLKQILDRGDSAIKTQAFNHLYDGIRDGSASIYETLSKLESWFPQDDRDIKKYPQSACFALRLLIKYCFETIYRFSQESLSSTSPDYVLFRFSNRDDASANLTRLVRWLLRPVVVRTIHDLESDAGMKNVLKSLGLERQPIRLLGALSAEWSVILGYLAQPPLGEEAEELAETWPVSASDVLKLLIETVALNTSSDQQRDLIIFWEESNRESLRSMNDFRLSSERRDQIVARWRRVFSLTQEFRRICLTAKAS